MIGRWALKRPSLAATRSLSAGKPITAEIRDKPNLRSWTWNGSRVAAWHGKTMFFGEFLDVAFWHNPPFALLPDEGDDFCFAKATIA